jgi:hypothetical protein
LFAEPSTESEEGLATPAADTTEAADAAVPDPAREDQGFFEFSQTLADEGAARSAMQTRADSVRNTLSEIRVRNELPDRLAEQAFYNDVEAATGGLYDTQIGYINEDNE